MLNQGRGWAPGFWQCNHYSKTRGDKYPSRFAVVPRRFKSDSAFYRGASVHNRLKVRKNPNRSPAERVRFGKEKQGCRSMGRDFCRPMTLRPCFDVVPVVGLDLRCGAGQVAALGRPRRPIHCRSRSSPSIERQKSRASRQGGSAFLVPVVGLEPTRCRHRRILNPLRLPFHHTGVLQESIYHFHKEFKYFLACRQK